MNAAPAVNDSNWKELVLESPVPVIVDFWAPWCGPCRMIAPLIDELAVEYGDKIKAVSISNMLPCIPKNDHFMCISTILLAVELQCMVLRMIPSPLT